MSLPRSLGAASGSIDSAAVATSDTDESGWAARDTITEFTTCWTEAVSTCAFLHMVVEVEKFVCLVAFFGFRVVLRLRWRCRRGTAETSPNWSVADASHNGPRVRSVLDPANNTA